MTSDWSVLLIGGTASVGKTNAAKRIATVSGATLLHVDDIRLALGITIPRDADLTLEAFRQTADTVSAALGPVVAHHLATSDPIVIEGLWITPELAGRTTYGGVGAERRRSVFVVEDARERTTPLTPFESAHARWVLTEAKRHSLAIVSARPVGHLAERILAVL